MIAAISSNNYMAEQANLVAMWETISLVPHCLSFLESENLEITVETLMIVLYQNVCVAILLLTDWYFWHFLSALLCLSVVSTKITHVFSIYLLN